MKSYTEQQTLMRLEEDINQQLQIVSHSHTTLLWKPHELTFLVNLIIILQIAEWYYIVFWLLKELIFQI